MNGDNEVTSSWRVVWKAFSKNKIGLAAFVFFLIIFFIGLYAPLFASSKPLIVIWGDQVYFPLFRYLFFRGFYTKPIDIFFNLLMFTLPLGLIGIRRIRPSSRSFFLMSIAALHLMLFCLLMRGVVKDPESEIELSKAKQKRLSEQVNYREDPLLASVIPYSNWDFEVHHMSPYRQLNQIVYHLRNARFHEKYASLRKDYADDLGREMPTLFSLQQSRTSQKREELASIIEENQEGYEEALAYYPELLDRYRPLSHDYIMAKYDLQQAKLSNNALLIRETEKKYQEMLQLANPIRIPLQTSKALIQKYRDAAAEMHFLDDRERWFKEEIEKLHLVIFPLFRPFHWEENAGGSQMINRYLPWYELTRINRKDLLSSLIFGIRVSLVVGISSVALSLAIGIPLGTLSGYFAGKSDLIMCRVVEIWEAMPTFFMLLLVVAITQSKSIFQVIIVLGIFGWTIFCRFIRAEMLRQRNLSYVRACKSLGFSHARIMFSHILPNAIFPILTLLPFSMMTAITSEAGLSFLGLGEEGSSSWGVLMDEGRSVFPGESYLLWPPAILLTLLLISIALIGDVLRDALDPKLRT